MWKLKQFMPKETAGLEGRTIDIGRSKVQVTKALAEGGFSCVYIARDAANPSKQYALKHMICNDDESLNLILKEISVMRVLKGHPHVVTLVASDILDMGRTKEAFLLMEFCDKSLVSVLESRGAGYYEEKQILLIFRDVCNAVFAMHCQSPPIAHRDLKAENLLIGSDGAWKLCDFGSTSTNHKCFDKPGEMGIEEDNIRKYTTPAYRAPEMWDLLRREVISEKVDIWALGCLLYRICYLKSAFDGESKLQILNGNYRIPELPKYSSSITDLIKDMLQASPDARPDITQVWFRVNLQLPVDLQKEMPDGSVATHTPELHNASASVHDEGATKRTTMMPRRSPPPSGSSPQLAKGEQQHRTSLGSSKASGDGAPLGTFWATEYAPDNQDMKDNGPVFDKEPVNQWASKHGQHGYEKRAILKEHCSGQPSRKTDWEDSLKRFDDGSSEDFEIRFDNGSSSVRTKLSHPENQKMKASYPENKAISQNETFNAFVAEFDTAKFNPAINNSTTSVKELEAEVRMLKDQLKQSNLEKTEITSKYEKLSAICRSQRQEIQELKQALAAKNQSLQNKGSSRNPSTTGSLSPAARQREKIEGSVFELQQGVSRNTSPSPTPESKEWQPFGNEANQQSRAMPSHPKSVRTSGSRQASKPSSSSVTTNSWGFEEDRFTAAPVTQQTPNTGSQGNRREAKKVETTKPAGWAGF